MPAVSGSSAQEWKSTFEEKKAAIDTRRLICQRIVAKLEAFDARRAERKQSRRTVMTSPSKGLACGKFLAATARPLERRFRHPIAFIAWSRHVQAFRQSR
jgi:hypothetical protein